MTLHIPMTQASQQQFRSHRPALLQHPHFVLIRISLRLVQCAVNRYLLILKHPLHQLTQQSAMEWNIKTVDYNIAQKQKCVPRE